jgi:hypothetical protein
MRAARKKKHKTKGHGAPCPFLYNVIMTSRQRLVSTCSTHRFLNASLLLLPILFLVQACAPQPASTPFRPPTSIPPTQPLPTTTPIPSFFTPATPTLTPTSTITPTPEPCTNLLEFTRDETVEDGTEFFGGAVIDKQWIVQNSGTCNWDATYKLKWVGGDPLGAAETQPLFPARAGTQATIRILFTAPVKTGAYESSWQAVDPNGNVFGELIFIKIVVRP